MFLKDPPMVPKSGRKLKKYRELVKNDRFYGSFSIFFYNF